MIFTSKTMIEALEGYGRNYCFPVCISLTRYKGLFLSEKRNAIPAFAGVTDDSIIIAIVSEKLFKKECETEYIEIPKNNIKKLDIRQTTNLNDEGHRMEICGKDVNGKKLRYVINVVGNVMGGDFNDQSQNSINFSNVIMGWLEDIE